ncbi:MAG: GNAT family N-acetyltransferase [Flavobacteriales bacterium]|nr:GNAT family N-acetyltransferase [Flavobacteriales bacterium]
MKTVQAMEKNGFFLMDTLVNYARDLHKTPLPEDSGQIPIRPVQSRDSEQVQQVACEAFKGYSGHYHADERLDSLECNSVYTSWAYNSCSSKELADEVLVADLEGKIVGFATLKFNSTEELAGVLFGVSPEAQGRGLYRSFMIHGMQWAVANNAQQMTVSTQIDNISVQKVWSRLGFEPHNSFYTFHKWFD